MKFSYINNRRIDFRYLYPADNELLAVDAVDKRRGFNLSSFH